MKNLFLLFITLTSFLSNAQLNKAGDIRKLNEFISLKKTEKGYVFIGSNGKISQEYTYVYLQNYGIIETNIVPPFDPKAIIFRESTNRCYVNDNSFRKHYHVFELMKELGTIDDYCFEEELTFSNIRDGLIEDYCWVSKDGKYAMVTPDGKFLTDLKYDAIGWFDDRESPFNFSRNRTLLFNKRKEKKRNITVILDKFTGKELFATKDSIVKYWNAKNYLIKKSKNKYYLVYKSKKQKVPIEFINLDGLPIESSIFTNVKAGKDALFMDINGKKIKSNLIPLSNFYKGHCIVLEKILEDQEFNYYGEPLYRKETNTVKIINEQFETIKILETFEQREHLESNRYHDYFNDYGQIIVSNRKESFVMDYMGNTIFKIDKKDTQIEEIYKGIYEVSDYERIYSNFYNQKGEKLINQKLLNMYRFDSFKFKEGINENYFTLYNHPNFPLIKLNKNNDIIFSEYQ